MRYMAYLSTGLVAFMSLSPVEAATISLPGSYEMSTEDIIVLSEGAPDRTIEFDLGILVGNEIDFNVRYGNLEVWNTAYGDTVDTGAFTIFHNDDLLLSVDGVTEGVFADIGTPVGDLVDEQGILQLRFSLAPGSDAMTFYRPWLFVTDDIAPGATLDLEVTQSFHTALRLEWTAPGDDGIEGTAAMYELRFSQSPVGDTAQWWDLAIQATDLPYPEEPGVRQSFVVPQLDTVSTYFFILVTYDELGNRSPFSNVASGTTGEGEPPAENYCLLFNGQNMFAQVPFNEILNPTEQITVEAWFKVEDEFVENPQCIIDKPYTVHEGPAYQYNLAPFMDAPDGDVDFFAHVAIENRYQPFNVFNVSVAGEWTHSAVVYDGTNARLFINAEEVASFYDPGQLSGYETGIRFGSLTNLPLWYFDGYIDEIRIWDIARSQVEIDSFMNHALDGDETGLIAYWNFDEGRDQWFFDQTLNGSDGFLGGGPGVDENDPTWVESDSPIEYDRTGEDESLFDAVPKAYELLQNFPNPFNAETMISFRLPGTSQISLEVYDMLGRRVCTLADNVFQAGEHRIKWSGRFENGDNLSSGIYFYRLAAGDDVITRRMLLLK